MTLLISIEYRTRWGEQLVLRLGKRRIALQYADGGVWTCAVERYAPAAQPAEYRYEVEREGVCIRSEWRPHTLRIPSREGVRTLRIRDRWQEMPSDTPFYSSAFTRGIFGRGKTGNPKKAAGNITLRVILPTLRPDETLAVAPLAMGAFILLFMDLSFNVTMQPFRALVADMLDDSQKTQGYVVQTFLINLGAVVGAILPLVMTWLGVSDEAAPGHVSPHIAYSYYAGGAILLLTVLVTSFKTREYPPGEFARYNNLSEEDAKPMSFVGLMRNVPGVMVRLGVTQFFSWAALFLMWTYLKPAITGVVTDHATGEVLSAGATQTWVGVLNGTYPIPACIAALFLGRVAARYGNKPVYAACLLAGALGFAGLCLLHDQYALMLPMVGIGIAWAGILAMPYAILSRAVEPRRMGVYMGIFNFTITVPQIVIGLTGGAIVKYCFASDAADMLALAGVFMLLAAVSVFLVKEHKAQ